MRTNIALAYNQSFSLIVPFFIASSFMYKAHSDNSLTGEFTKSNDPIRSNFRA